jgi:cobalt-precorrin-6B (C15)-methyltransferase
MTKEEVRVVALSKLKIGPGSSLLDVGCGTGSIAVEAALMGARVYAVDKSPEAVELTRLNAEKFGVADRVTAVVGEAPGDLPRGKVFDAVFIGGGGRRLPEIVAEALKLVRQGGRVVMDVVALESLSAVVPLLRGLDHEVVLIQVAKGREVGGYTIMSPLNPVYIVTIRT